MIGTPETPPSNIGRPEKKANPMSTERRLHLTGAVNSLNALGRLATGNFKKDKPFDPSQDRIDSTTIYQKADKVMNDRWSEDRKKAWEGDTRTYTEQLDEWATDMVRRYFLNNQTAEVDKGNIPLNKFLLHIGYSGNFDQGSLKNYFISEDQSGFGKFDGENGTANLADALTENLRKMQKDDPNLEGEIQGLRDVLKEKPIREFLGGIFAGRVMDQSPEIDAFISTVELRIADKLKVFENDLLTNDEYQRLYQDALKTDKPNEPAMFDYFAGKTSPAGQSKPANADTPRADGARTSKPIGTAIKPDTLPFLPPPSSKKEKDTSVPEMSLQELNDQIAKFNARYELAKNSNGELIVDELPPLLLLHRELRKREQHPQGSGGLPNTTTAIGETYRRVEEIIGKIYEENIPRLLGFELDDINDPTSNIGRNKELVDEFYGLIHDFSDYGVSGEQKIEYRKLGERLNDVKEALKKAQVTSSLPQFRYTNDITLDIIRNSYVKEIINKAHKVRLS